MSRFLRVLFLLPFVAGCGSSSTTNVSGPTTVRCAVTITNPAGPIAAAGGAAELAVGINRECTWTASSQAEWIRITSGTSGQGEAMLSLSVAPNPLAEPRTGFIFVNDQRFEVTQAGAPCTYQLSTMRVVVGGGGGMRTVTVSAPPSCGWTARSEDGWIAIDGNSSGSGTGTVRLSVAPLTDGTRTGTAIVAGQTVVVEQTSDAFPGDPPAPDPGCTFALSATSITVSADGESGSVTVQAGDGCTWGAVSDAPWLSITGGVSGAGTGTIQFVAQSNQTGAPRAATISVGSASVLVTQTANVVNPVCAFTVTPDAVSAPAGGLATSVSIQALDAPCSWTAVSNASWLVISGAASGSGSGVLNFTALANPDATPRSGTLTVAGRTVTVTQEAAQGTACAFTLSSTTASVPAAGSTGRVDVTASGASCAWTASSNASWITITAGSSVTGSGQVAFSVAPNTETTARTGTLIVAGQTVTITQAAAAAPACSFTLSTTTASAPATGGTGQVDVTASDASCAWTASSNASWIMITAGSSATGSGQVAYTVAPNTETTERTGTLIVAGQTVTITQDAAPAPACSFTLSTTTASVPDAGGAGHVDVTASDASCGWTASSNEPWITITAGSSATGSGQVAYNVAPNTVATERTGTLTVAGQIVTVTQAAAPAPCSFTLSTTGVAAPAAGASGQVDVSASDPTCAWSATSNDAWIVISAGSSGTGNGAVSYLVEPNPAQAERTGTLTVAGQTVTVTQAPADAASVELEGEISGLSGSCPNLTFVVRSQTIVTNSQTSFSSGCGGLRDGRSVIVRGLTQPDGSVLASEVVR